MGPINVNTTQLSKEYILANVSQITIFAHYLNIATDTIEKCVNSKLLINSPFREDKRPSFGFYVGSNGMIYAKDLGYGFHGDCFDAVARYLSLFRPLSGKDFIKVLEDVANKFLNNNRFTETVILSPTSYLKTESKKFDVYVRDFNHYDIAYWKQYYITIDILNKFRVEAIYELYIDNVRVYKFSFNDLGYVYNLSHNTVQCYFPNRKNNATRFYINNWIVMNGRYIKKHKYGVIIKAYKEVMFLSNYEEEYDMQAIAPSTESTILSQEQMNFIAKYWNIIFTLSDFDRTGILFGLRMQRKYGTTPLFLTNGNYGTIDFGAKDPTDYVNKYNKKQFDKLIEFVSKYDIKDDYDKLLKLTNDMGHYRRKDLPNVPYR